MKPSYVYDIETQDWTTFVCGAVFDGKRLRLFDWKQEREFVEFLLSLKGEVYAHNGGRFDHLWLLDASYRFGLQRHAHVIENSTGIICLDFGESKFLDSFRLFPMSLRRLTNGGKQDLSDLCKCGKACGGYCAINRKMPPKVRKLVLSYLEADVRELWNALGHFQTVAAECKIELGMTVGSTAWKSAAAELSLPEEPYGQEIAQWKFVRQGYYGGRSEIFRTASHAGYQYDVNSMYPAKIASIALPLEYKGRVYGSTATARYRNDYPGIYRATVFIPDSFIPPLPYRTKKGRVLYPTGRIVGTWTALELKYAESQGCRIEFISEAAVFARSKVLFKKWVDRIFAVRMKYGKDTREGYWLKLVLNSITGKFGAKVSHRSYLIDPCFAGDRCRDRECRGKKVELTDGWNSAGTPAITRVWYRDFERIQKCGHVEWAAYLTAAARVTLHKGLTAGNDDAVYCDTDSIFSENERTENIGNSLGQWKEEGAFENFRALAPKVYCYHRVSDGVKIVKAKGIPNPNIGDKRATKKFWEALTTGKPIEYWSIAGLRNPVQGQFFARRFLSRRVSQNFGGRIEIPGREETRAPSSREVSIFER